MIETRFPSRRAPLVGRVAELGQLQLALDEAASGHGRMVLVSGEPGIGKTRLVEEFAKRATASGALVASGLVDEENGAPAYSPWTQLLNTVVAEGDRSMVRGALEASTGAIAAILPDAKELPSSAAPLPVLPVLPAAPARFRLLASNEPRMTCTGRSASSSYFP